LVVLCILIYIAVMKKYALLILFLGTLIMIVVMGKTGAPLITAATPNGIIQLEFAYDTAKTNTVIQAWASDGSTNRIGAAQINTYLDFIFLFFYALFLFFTCDKIARISKSKTGTMIANGVIWAGLLDILENAGMLMTLSGKVSGTIAFMTTFFSVLKWGLVIAAILYVLLGSIQLIAKKKIKWLFV
ncbi:MAG: hypothetical protein WCI49_14635, partial [Ferruginibacter sp.]